MDVGLHLRQSLQLRLAPQIIQSIEILQLPTMDLRNLIEDALQENEALEVVEEAADALGPAPAESRADEGEGDEDEGAGLDPDAERTLERLEGLAEEIVVRGRRGARGAAVRAAPAPGLQPCPAHHRQAASAGHSSGAQVRAGFARNQGRRLCRSLEPGFRHR